MVTALAGNKCDLEDKRKVTAEASSLNSLFFPTIRIDFFLSYVEDNFCKSPGVHEFSPTSVMC